MKTRMAMLATAAALLLTGMPLAVLAQGAEAQAQPAGQAQADTAEAEKKLLEIGQIAPDFTLPLVTGGEVTLSTLRKFGKAVLVGFWGIETENGGADLVKMQKLHDELESKGLTTVMINPVEDLPTTKKFVDRKKVQLQVCIDGKETNRACTNTWKAKTLPTYYLLDPEGKVLYRSVTLKEPALREAIAKAGVK